MFLISVTGQASTLVSQDIEWTRAKGLFGGNVEAIAFASECEIYVGTVDAGLHFTNDCGESWMDLGFNFVGPNLAHINGLMVDDDGTVYMAINSRGVFRLAPGIDEWTQWNAGLPLDQYDCLDKGIDGRPTICTRGFGLFQLMDGSNWEQLDDPNLSGADVRGFAVNDSLLVIGTKGGEGVYFYRFNEEASSTIGSIDSNIIRDIHIDGEYVFAPTISKGIRMLSLRDTLWQTITTDLPTGQFQSVTTSNGRVYAGSFGLGVFSRAIDMSDAWVRELHIDLTSNILTTKNGILYSGTNSGLYMKEGLDEFKAIGPETGLVRTFEESNDVLYAGLFDNGIWKSTDDGMTWSQDFASSFGFFSIFAMPSMNLILAGTYDREVFTSTVDPGLSWKSIGLPFRQTNAFAVAPNGDILAASNSGISRLKNNSNTWTSTELSSLRVRDLHARDNQIVAITSESVFANNMANDDTWELLSDVTLSTSAWSADAHEDLIVVNTPPNGLLSVNLSSMETQEIVLPTLDIVDVKILDYDRWLAADYSGWIHLSLDAGQSWETISRSPEESKLRKIWVTQNGSILLGTESNGIFNSGPVIPTSHTRDIPERGNLMSIYPNPTSSDLTIKIENLFGQKIEWVIMDNLGRIVLDGIADRVSGGAPLKIDLEEIVRGLYIFSFTLDGQNFGGSKTFIVN